MAKLDEKLKALLASQPIDKEIDIDAVAKQLGLDESSKALLRETWKNLDEIEEKAEDLKKAKEEKGWSVKRWITNRLWKKMGDMKDEGKAKVIEGISVQLEKKVNEEVEQTEKEA